MGALGHGHTGAQGVQCAVCAPVLGSGALGTEGVQAQSPNHFQGERDNGVTHVSSPKGRERSKDTLY